jgi:antitoxin protein of toxin-antitoxin system
MSLLRKLAVLGAAAEAARRYAKQNPDKARELTEKAARFADQQTKGRYHQHIETARRALANAGGFSEPDQAAAQPPLAATAEVINPTPRPTPYKRG